MNGGVHGCREEGASSTLNENFEDFESLPSDGSPYLADTSMGGSAPSAQEGALEAQDAGDVNESYGDADVDGDADVGE